MIVIRGVEEDDLMKKGSKLEQWKWFGYAATVEEDDLMKKGSKPRANAVNACSSDKLKKMT